jgi:hypothetical protein
LVNGDDPAMSTLDLNADSRRPPSEVITDLALSDDAVALMADCSNILSFLNRLCDEKLFHDAFVTLARALPRQYAIMWSDQCLKFASNKDISDKDQHCINIVKQWVSNPDEVLRRAALDAAEAVEFDGAYAWFAAAVGFSGGSLAPRDLEEVPPPQHLTAVAIAAYLVMLSIENPETMAETSRKMIDAGLAMVAMPGSSDNGASS